MTIKNKALGASELQLFPTVNMVLSYLDAEKYSTISSLSKAFKLHPMSASDIVKKMAKAGLVSIESIGSAKIIKRATE